MGRPDYLILGRIIKAHGIRGEAKVVLYADDWAPFRGFSRCWVGPRGGPFQPFEIEGESEHGRTVALKLVGVDAPGAVAPLLGHEVAIPRADAPPPPDGTFYHYDILGLEVVAGDRSLGSVREIVETPAHDVYVIQRDTGEWLLPATRVYIRRIDLAAGRIELQPSADVAGLGCGEQKEERGSESV
jgi:16S rRNA processing protein RimM